jgi:hypothetical protein
MDQHPDLMSYWHDLIHQHEVSHSTELKLNAWDIENFLDSLLHLPESTLQIIQDCVDQGMDLMKVISTVNTLDINNHDHNLVFRDAFGTLQELTSGTPENHPLASAFGTLNDLNFDTGKGQVMQSAQSTLADRPSITIDNLGKVWRHDCDGSEHHVGYVDDGRFKNLVGAEVGYVHRGTFYTDHYMIKEYGKVHGGIIFNEDDKQIGTADTDLEGHAYLAFVVRGGMP